MNKPPQQQTAHAVQITLLLLLALTMTVSSLLLRLSTALNATEFFSSTE
jgi:hypothetical protein